MTTKRVYNFSPGPAVLPLPVLEQVQKDLLALPSVGSSILEISHRGPAFLDILQQAESDLRRLLSIPDNFRILFLQGGARLQFSMVPLNLLRETSHSANFLLTGSWSVKALDEARRAGSVRVIWDGGGSDYDRIPTEAEFHVESEAAYLHFTSNETIQGVQFSVAPRSGSVPLVCDASSDLLCRPIPVHEFDLIYACAQKNIGPAGLTIVLIREDLLERCADDIPGYLSYREHIKHNSLYNTPPTFGVYVAGLVARWLLDEVGGLDKMAQINREKAKWLYDVIDHSEGFYRGHAQSDCRSMMNVTFQLSSEELQADFLKQAEQRRLHNLQGHRSVGGIRASIYNAMPREGVIALRNFMQEFLEQNCERRQTED